MNQFMTGRIKRILSAILAIMMVGALAACSRSNQTAGSVPPPVASEPQAEEPSRIPPEVSEALYSSVTGNITAVDPFYENDGTTAREGWYYVYLTDDNGGEHCFAITEGTYMATDDELAVGAKVVGFYDSNAPMIMIYPPRYNVEVVAVNPDDAATVKLDRFNEELVSSDNQLKLNIGEDTEIILQDGMPFEGDLTNRKLVVFYNISTRSIPAQTTPIKIVVLFETAEASAYEYEELESRNDMQSPQA